MTVAGVIIAGGRSRRMGTDKLTLELRGKRIIDHVIERLAPQVDRLAINANDHAERFAGYDVIPDLRPSGTPLAGLHAALIWGESQGFSHVLTSSGDTPFLPPDLRHRLEIHGCAIAHSMGQFHYLIGLWPVSCLPQLSEDISRVRDWVVKVRAASVDWAGDPFLNINTPDDLAMAETRAATSS
jgi:molybdopterin-guanine dinucleotide biosynthesis protein A